MSPRSLSLVLIRTLAVLVAFLGMAELVVFPFVLYLSPVGPDNQPRFQSSLAYLQSGAFYTIVGLVLLAVSKRLAGIAAKPCEEEKKEPIQPPQTTTGSSAPDRV